LNKRNPLCHAASAASLLPVVTPEDAPPPRRGVFCCGAYCELQVADAAAYLSILGIAGRLPEGSGLIVLEGNQRGYSADTAAAQILLSGPHQRDPYALPPQPVANGETVYVPSPPVPAGDQSADDLLTALGDKESRRGIGDQVLDVLRPVGGGRVPASRLSPELQDRLGVVGPASTYRDSLNGGQVNSVTRDTSRVTRRWGLIASGIATVVLLLAMSPAENRMKDTGGPGMIPFELTGGQHRADEILSEWGEGGQDAARESLRIDFGFLFAYGTFLTLALAAARDMARQRGWPRLSAVGGVVVSFGALGAAFDALENACLLLTLDGAGAAFPLLATIFAACKFILLTVAIAYLLAALVMRLVGRVPATPAP